MVVARTDEEAHRLADDLAAWVGGGHVRTLPERAALPLERALAEHDESAERLERPRRTRLAARLIVVGVAPGPGAADAGPRPGQARPDQLRVGGRVAQRALLEGLVAGGYEPVVEVDRHRRSSRTAVG